MELRHGCRTSIGEFTQVELLSAAEKAEVRLFPQSLGTVFRDNNDFRPKSRNDGIVATMLRDKSYDYWAIHRSGDFFAVSTFSEDGVQENSLFVWNRIQRTAEAIAHCARLYKALGADSHCMIELEIAYKGLRNRILMAPYDIYSDFGIRAETEENEVSSSVTFRLNIWESELSSLVKALCAPLFVLFEFTVIEDAHYERVVSDFVARMG